MSAGGGRNEHCGDPDGNGRFCGPVYGDGAVHVQRGREIQRGVHPQLSPGHPGGVLQDPPARGREPPLEKVALTKGVGILLFTAVLSACALLAGARTFLQGFWLTFGLMVWIGAFDTFFLDWVLFANLKMFRLEGTEHMDRAYHQKWFHLKGMLFPGIVFALIPAALAGLLVSFVR